MFFWRTQKKKKGAGTDFKFMPPTNSQQTLIFAVAADPLQQERYTAAAGPTGHNEELDYYQRGGAGMEGKKNESRGWDFFSLCYRTKIGFEALAAPSEQKKQVPDEQTGARISIAGL